MKKTFLRCCIIISLCISTLLSNDLADIKERGELRHLGFLYANFITGSGDGLDVELMKGFAKYLNVEYRFVPTTLPKLFGDLIGTDVKSGKTGAVFLNKTPIKGDIISSGITILDWREEVANFSTPIFPSGIWLVARSDSSLTPIKPTGSILNDITNVKNALETKSVLAVENTCLDPRLYNMKETKADIKLKSQDSELSELVPRILNKEAESTLLDVADALIALEKWPGEVKVVGPISEEQYLGVAVRKTSPNLLKEFNKYFKQIKENGKYNKLVKKYYPGVFYYYRDFFE